MGARYRISRKGIDLIKAFEGLRLTAVRLPDGRYTIGHGHTVSAREGATITAADAEALLIFDLLPVIEAVGNLVFTPLTQNQFDALVAFAFNVGVDEFRGSEVLRRVNEGRLTEAACAIDLWRKADLGGDPVILDALIRRRAAEKAHFLTPSGGFVPTPSPLIRPQADTTLAPALPASRPEEFAVEESGSGVSVRRVDVPEPAEPAPQPSPPAPAKEPAPEPAPVDAAPEHRGVAEPQPEPEPPAPEPSEPTPAEIEVERNAAAEPGAEALDRPAPPAPEPPKPAVAAAAAMTMRMYSAYPGAVFGEGPLLPKAVKPGEIERESGAAPPTPAPAEPSAPPVQPDTSARETATAEPGPMFSPDNAPLLDARPLVLTPPPEAPFEPGVDSDQPDDQAQRDDEVAELETPLFDETWEEEPAPMRVVRLEEDSFDGRPSGSSGPFLVLGAVGLVAFGGAVAAFFKAREALSQPMGVLDDPTWLAWTLAVIGAGCVGTSVYFLLKRIGGVED